MLHADGWITYPAENQLRILVFNTGDFEHVLLEHENTSPAAARAVH